MSYFSDIIKNIFKQEEASFSPNKAGFEQNHPYNGWHSKFQNAAVTTTNIYTKNIQSLDSHLHWEFFTMMW